MPLSGCKMLHPYQPDIQQGNLFSEQDVAKVKIGMSQAQVEAILGKSILNDPTDPNHLVYVYTFQHNAGKIMRKNVDIYLAKGRVVQIMQSKGTIA